jgi:hypothetical protein
LVVVVPLAGAMLPGDALLSGDAVAAFGAPVGAGELMAVCAIAAPAVRQNAAVAIKSVRIANSLKL